MDTENTEGVMLLASTPPNAHAGNAMPQADVWMLQQLLP